MRAQPGLARCRAQRPGGDLLPWGPLPALHGALTVGPAALAFLLRPANRASAPGVPVMTASQTWLRVGHPAGASGACVSRIWPCHGASAKGPGNSPQCSESPAGCWAPPQPRSAGAGPHFRGQGAACSARVSRRAREAQPSPPARPCLPPETGGGDGAGEGPGLPRPSRHSEAGPGDTSVATRFN